MSAELFNYQTYKYKLMKYMNNGKCLGLYCGRIPYGDDIYSDCGSCPWGTRTNLNKICELCMDSPSLYDWMYLIFIVAGYLMIQIMHIDQMVPIPRSVTSFNARSRIVLTISVILEFIIASVSTLAIFDPIGELSLRSCRPRKFKDWYTPLCFKRIAIGEKIRCPQEAIYPLYSIVFYFFGISMILMSTIRILLCTYFRCQKEAFAKNTQAVLYVIPLWGIVYGVFAGVIYKFFPYISITVAVTYNVLYFVTKIYESTNSLVMDTIFAPKKLLIIFTQWAIQAFGIVAMAEKNNSPLDYMSLVFIPLPTILYVLTMYFRDMYVIDGPFEN